MKATAIWIIMQATILVGSACFAAPASANRHKFLVTFEETQLEGIASVRQFLIDQDVIEGTLNEIAGEIRLPRDIAVTFKDCEGPDAFWDPEQKSVTFCYNLIQLYDTGYDVLKDDEPTFLEGVHEDTVVIATTIFVLLHELGHAFVDLYQLPVTGREEDAVDQLATFLLLDPEETDPASTIPLVAAYFFKRMDTYLAEIGRYILADEHSLGQQRYYSIMCLVLGSNSEAYAPVLAAGFALVEEEAEENPDAYDTETIVKRLADTDAMNILPYTRAVRCEDEYAKYRESWDYMRDQFMAK